MINDFLVSILNGINSFIGNYAMSIVVFTLLIKCLLMPFDYKSRKSMRRMSSMQPQIAKLQKRYANDREKLNQKTAELYRKERINPISGCVPMLLSFPVLICMFSAMRYVANLELANQAINMLTSTTIFEPESFLWIKNLWMPDSPFATTIPDHANLNLIPADVWATALSNLQGTDILGQLANLGITADNINGEIVFTALQKLPSYTEHVALWETMPSLNFLFFNLNIYQAGNGWFLLPVLSAATQFLMTTTQPQTMPTDPNAPGAGMNKMMKYFFPLFSLYICSSYNAAFALYWVASNIFAWVQGIVFNKMFEKQDKVAKEVTMEDSLK